MKILKCSFILILLIPAVQCSQSPRQGPKALRFAELQRIFGNPAGFTINDENRRVYNNLLNELGGMLSVYEYTDPADFADRLNILYNVGIYASATAWKLGYQKEAGLIYLNSLIIKPDQSFQDITHALKPGKDEADFFRNIVIPDYTIIKENKSDVYNSDILIKSGPYTDLILNAAAGHYLYQQKLKDENITGLKLTLHSPQGPLAKVSWSKEGDTLTLIR